VTAVHRCWCIGSVGGVRGRGRCVGAWGWCVRARGWCIRVRGRCVPICTCRWGERRLHGATGGWGSSGSRVYQRRRVGAAPALPRALGGGPLGSLAGRRLATLGGGCRRATGLHAGCTPATIRPARHCKSNHPVPAFADNRTQSLRGYTNQGRTGAPPTGAGVRPGVGWGEVAPSRWYVWVWASAWAWARARARARARQHPRARPKPTAHAITMPAISPLPRPESLVPKQLSSLE
jgi:hypothetical protein